MLVFGTQVKCFALSSELGASSGSLGFLQVVSGENMMCNLAFPSHFALAL